MPIEEPIRIQVIDQSKAEIQLKAKYLPHHCPHSFTCDVDEDRIMDPNNEQLLPISSSHQMRSSITIPSQAGGEESAK